MRRLTGTDWLKLLGLVGLGYVAVTKGPKLLRRVSGGARSSKLYNGLAERVDHAVGWDKLPTALGLAALIGVRNKLRAENLYDTNTVTPTVPTPLSVAQGERHLTARMDDGTFNDLSRPAMGAAGARFGRNFPISYGYPEPEPAILEPSPRTVSRELMTRHTFTPATTLNVLAAAWLLALWWLRGMV